MENSPNRPHLKKAAKTPDTSIKQAKQEAQKKDTGLSPEGRRALDALLLIIDDADKAKLQQDRERFLQEFLTKSAAFVQQYPNQKDVWVLRAAAAVELKRSEEGWEAGKRMQELGLSNSNDPKVRKIMASLERNGWMGEYSPEESKRRAEAETRQKADEARAEAERQLREKAPQITQEFAAGMVSVPAGCFSMGDGSSVHEVCVDGFQIGKYEVTQAQWEAVMGSNPASNKKGGAYPVENVSWTDAQEFITKLNAATNQKYRLPTEAEWEYACRSGGKKEEYCGGDQPDNLAWHEKNSGGTTHPVGTKQANGLGLYDMSGNVWEWCADWYDENYYRSSPQKNPPGPASGALRVTRGGSWYYDPWNARAAYRGRSDPGYRFNDLGLRLVLPPGQQ